MSPDFSKFAAMSFICMIIKGSSMFPRACNLARVACAATKKGSIQSRSQITPEIVITTFTHPSFGSQPTRPDHIIRPRFILKQKISTHDSCSRGMKDISGKAGIIYQQDHVEVLIWFLTISDQPGYPRESSILLEDPWGLRKSHMSK